MVGLLLVLRSLDAHHDEDRQGRALWACSTAYSLAHTRGDSEKVSLHLPSLGAGDLTCGSLLRMFPDAMRHVSQNARIQDKQSGPPPQPVQRHQPTTAALTAYARGEMLKDRGEWDKAATMFDSALALDSGFHEACYELKRIRPRQRCEGH